MFSSTQLLIGGIILLVIGYFIIYGSSSMSIKEGLSNTPSCANLPGGAPCVPWSDNNRWYPGQKCGGWVTGVLASAWSHGHYTGYGTGWTGANQWGPCPITSCYSGPWGPGALPTPGTPGGSAGGYRERSTGVLHPTWICMLPEKPLVCTSSICNAQTQIFTGTNVICNGPTCTPEECCENRAQCSSLKPKKLPTPGPAWSPGSDDGCDLSKYDAKPSDTYCDGVTCSVSECCTPDPTCAGYDCPVDTYHPKPNLAGIRCGINQVCTTDDCCTINPTCSGFSSCPIHEHLKDNAGAIRCTSATCNSTECCGWNPKCSTHACPENTYYNLFTHIPNASSVFCDTQTCTDDQCCIVTPTGNLPKVQTYPLFSQ